MDEEQYQVAIQQLKNKLFKQIEFIKSKKIPKQIRINKAVVITDFDIELHKIQLAVIATSSLKILSVFENRLATYLKIVT